MNNKKYNWLLYLITATIVATLAVQLYWNYKNYEQNKQRVLNEIQQSLDDAVENYYTNLSKENFYTIVEPTTIKTNEFFGLNETMKSDNRKHIRSIEIKTDNKSEFNKIKSVFIDSVIMDVTDDINSELHSSSEKTQIKGFTQMSGDGRGIHVDGENNTISSVKIYKGKKAQDSLKLIKGLQTIFVAIQKDSLEYSNLDSILKTNLNKKKINIDFGFKHFKKDTLFHSYNLKKNDSLAYTTEAKSTYFHNNQRLKLYHTNPSLDALKRSSTGILLSLLLSLAIISSLFYLLKIINQQKQLAEIKNDLISNITHEFKTPIATVSTAVEALENFNAVNDTEKTKKYLNISSVQLKKLHGMVEKLLETATLDSEKLLLNKEETDIISLTEKIVNKHKLIAPDKNIQFSANTKEQIIQIDSFHLENVISNLIDNAVKYGGNEIDVTINSVLKTVELTVADNGKGIDKNQQEKIFDKFYRVPKGNVHDVKGFGIGLYYTKKIVEKHGGTITLNSKPNNTIFKVTLPNENKL